MRTSQTGAQVRGLGADLGRWRKASYSDTGTACVETVLWENGEIGVRDSTRPNDTALRFRAYEWTTLLQHAQAG